MSRSAAEQYLADRRRMTMQACLSRLAERLEPSFVIESGIPIPPRRRGGRSGAYPFGDMKPGDSFFHPGSASSVEAAAAQYGRRHGCSFTARYVPGGVRIWRVA